ncbi:hypothetical protein BXZ70DRAFT_911620 [Cristinia sonorae]|uniref:Uncharacterized protein n=1 Tax=Cristinia sonorae TaxID=1940300 RepID=A0A8K0UCP2_9AGAR|nr:hypothetical protein BXZ70DRAFT_911620 [Cristinia sonorae]
MEFPQLQMVVVGGPEVDGSANRQERFFFVSLRNHNFQGFSYDLRRNYNARLATSPLKTSGGDFRFVIGPLGSMGSDKGHRLPPPLEWGSTQTEGLSDNTDGSQGRLPVTSATDTSPVESEPGLHIPSVEVVLRRAEDRAARQCLPSFPKDTSSPGAPPFPPPLAPFLSTSATLRPVSPPFAAPILPQGNRTHIPQTLDKLMEALADYLFDQPVFPRQGFPASLSAQFLQSIAVPMEHWQVPDGELDRLLMLDLASEAWWRERKNYFEGLLRESLENSGAAFLILFLLTHPSVLDRGEVHVYRDCLPEMTSMLPQYGLAPVGPISPPHTPPSSPFLSEKNANEVRRFVQSVFVTPEARRPLADTLAVSPTSSSSAEPSPVEIILKGPPRLLPLGTWLLYSSGSRFSTALLIHPVCFPFVIIFIGYLASLVSVVNKKPNYNTEYS